LPYSTPQLTFNSRQYRVVIINDAVAAFDQPRKFSRMLYLSIILSFGNIAPLFIAPPPEEKREQRSKRAGSRSRLDDGIPHSRIFPAGDHQSISLALE
jgi:hypothetical protein